MSIPVEVMWSYCSFGLVLAIGVAVRSLRGGWQRARGFDTLILVGPLLYGAPLAGFGVEHFTRTAAIASIVPAWMPWHRFWVYVVGAWLAVTVLVIEVAVYVPIAVVERASLDKGFNFLADTLMFAGALLLLAGVLPRNGDER